MKRIIKIAAFVLAAIVLFSAFDRIPAAVNEFFKEKEGGKTLVSSDKSHGGALVLVNGEHSYFDVGEKIVKLYEKKTDSFFMASTEIELNERAVKPLCDMLDAFRDETGLKKINVISGYRSVESQQEIYNQKAFKYGNIYAKKYVQSPGSSEHHTGLCVDLSIYNAEDGSSSDFDGTGDYSWFSKNAQRFGFVLRYPKEKEKITGIGYEPWHFRYVGVAHATFMAENGLCLEEYITLLQSKTKKNPLEIKLGNKTVKVWHTSKKPKSGNFSGDNCGGYIIWK